MLLISWMISSHTHTYIYLFTFLAEFQEWPEEDYPPYANGPGYILSSDIAGFIISEFEKNKLRVSLISLLFTFSPLVYVYSYWMVNKGGFDDYPKINELFYITDVQDGRREHGNVGGAVQQFKTSRLSAQLELLSVRLHRRLLHCTLPIPPANDLHVGKIGATWKTPML